jgi:hypothetical protein
MHQMDTPPIVTAELMSSKLFQSTIKSNNRSQICDGRRRSILIEETPEAGSSVDEFERRASTNQADN